MFYSSINIIFDIYETQIYDRYAKVINSYMHMPDSSNILEIFIWIKKLLTYSRIPTRIIKDWYIHHKMKYISYLKNRLNVLSIAFYVNGIFLSCYVELLKLF